MSKFFLILHSSNRCLTNNRAGKKFEHNTKSFKVDVDAYPTAKAFFDIKSTPTVLVYKNGKELKKVEGLDEEKAKEIASVLV